MSRFLDQDFVITLPEEISLPPRGIPTYKRITAKDESVHIIRDDGSIGKKEYTYDYEVDNTMSESQSRYSIIENLTKEKTATEDYIKRVKQTMIQKELDLKRFLEDNERDVKHRKEDDENFKAQAKLDIVYQTAKTKELEKAIVGIKDISKSVEKKE